MWPEPLSDVFLLLALCYAILCPKQVTWNKQNGGQKLDED